MLNNHTTCTLPQYTLCDFTWALNFPRRNYRAYDETLALRRTTMIDSIKKFIAEHDTEIALTVCVTAGVLMGAWTARHFITGGKEVLVLPKNAVNDLLAGKDVLLDCLEDAHLLVKYIP